MNNNDKLQIPINSKLKRDFKKKCESMGFSSLNEALRVMLHNFTYSSVTLQLMDKTKPEHYIAPYIEVMDEATEKRVQESYKAYENNECAELDLKDKNWFKKLTS